MAHQARRVNTIVAALPKTDELIPYCLQPQPPWQIPTAAVSYNNTEGAGCRYYINVDTGRFGKTTLTLGARADSYYEYLLKQWIAAGKPAAGQPGHPPPPRGHAANADPRPFLTGASLLGRRCQHTGDGAHGERGTWKGCAGVLTRASRHGLGHEFLTNYEKVSHGLQPQSLWRTPTAVS